MLKLKSVGILSLGVTLGALYAGLAQLVGGMFTLISLAGFAAVGPGSAKCGSGSRLRRRCNHPDATHPWCRWIHPRDSDGTVLQAGRHALFYNLVAVMTGGIELELTGWGDSTYDTGYDSPQDSTHM